MFRYNRRVDSFAKENPDCVFAWCDRRKTITVSSKGNALDLLTELAKLIEKERRAVRNRTKSHHPVKNKKANSRPRRPRRRT